RHEIHTEVIAQFLVIGAPRCLRVASAAERETVAGFGIAKHLAQARAGFVLVEVVGTTLFSGRVPTVAAFTFDGRQDIGKPADSSNTCVGFGRGENVIERVYLGLLQFPKAIAETVEKSIAVKSHSPSCFASEISGGSSMSTIHPGP